MIIEQASVEMVTIAEDDVFTADCKIRAVIEFTCAAEDAVRLCAATSQKATHVTLRIDDLPVVTVRYDALSE